MAPKVVRWQAAAIYAQCPYCGADIASKDGSYMLVEDDDYSPHGRKACRECGEEFRFPWADKLRGPSRRRGG